MERARFRETRIRRCLQACAVLHSADATRRSELLSRTAHDRWVVQSGHLMLVVPYAHVSESETAVIRKFFIGPGARRRAHRWLRLSPFDSQK